MDGASENTKAFRIFGDETIGEASKFTVKDLRAEFRNKNDERLQMYEDELKDLYDTKYDEDGPEFEFCTLSDLWDESDETLPKRIRCIVHLLALISDVKFENEREKNGFWKHHPHAPFKSK